MKKFEQFINENTDISNITNDKKFMLLTEYIVNLINKETEFIMADPIKNEEVKFHKDPDGDTYWFYADIPSFRLSTAPSDETIEDQMSLLKDLVKGYDVLHKILDDLNTGLNIFIHSMISKGPVEHSAYIKLTVQETIFEEDKVINFLKSDKTINKFNL